MADFMDRRRAAAGAFYWLVRSGGGGADDVTADNASFAWCYPRQTKVRTLEAAPSRSPQAYVYIGGGSALTGGETVFDATNVAIQQGFLDDASDRVLAFSMCTFDVPVDSVTNAPRAGDWVWVQLGVDRINRLTVFGGVIESAETSEDGRAYSVVAYDEIRRLLDFPFRRPGVSSDVGNTYRKDWTDTNDEAAIQVQISDMLADADVLCTSMAGIEQYPDVPSRRETVYEEIAALLRAANCRAYLSPGGRLIVTYNDELPQWMTAARTDLGSRPGISGISSESTRFHLPLVCVRAVYPDRVVAQDEGIFGIGPPWTNYPDQYVTDQNVPWTMPMFEFNAHNVTGIQALPDSTITNDVRANTTQRDDTLTGVDTQGVTGSDLESMTLIELGDRELPTYEDTVSVAAYGRRSRGYDLGGLDPYSRATSHPTAVPGATAPSVNYGRYSIDGWDWSESQARARRFPVDRIRLTSPGILSLSPFEVVTVNLPAEGVQGYYQIEGRELRIGPGGFRSMDTLRRMSIPEQIVTLDARD